MGHRNHKDEMMTTDVWEMQVSDKCFVKAIDMPPLPNQRQPPGTGSGPSSLSPTETEYPEEASEEVLPDSPPYTSLSLAFT